MVSKVSLGPHPVRAIFKLNTGTGERADVDILNAGIFRTTKAKADCRTRSTRTVQCQISQYAASNILVRENVMVIVDGISAAGVFKQGTSRMSRFVIVRMTLPLQDDLGLR